MIPFIGYFMPEKNKIGNFNDFDYKKHIISIPIFGQLCFIN